MDEPKISDLIDVGTKALIGQADKSNDINKGSDYSSLVGPTSILWTRQDRRDEDLFRATRFHTATGYDLTYLVKKRYGIDRILDTRGTGYASLVRPAGGVGGTVWAGTRVAVLGSRARTYRVSSDTVVVGSAGSVIVPIEAIEPGVGYEANDTTNLGLLDPLWDAGWTVVSITCSNGTAFEKASDLIARVRQTRLDARVGQVKAIESYCRAAGATKVLVFRSDYGGAASDGGLNVVYVGDEGYQGTPSLVKACFLALRNCRVLGDHMQVLQLNRVVINPVIDVFLATAPALNDIERLQRIHVSSITQYLGGSSGGFAFTKIGILSAVARYTPEVQHVNVVDPPSDVSVLVGGHLPPVLNRYVVGTVTLRYFGP